jgi:hypothetical protein
MKKCCRCKKKKTELEFGANKSNPDGLQRYCRKCKRGIANSWYNSSCKTSHLENVRKNNKKYREIMQDAVWDYLKQHPCQVCGEKDPILLEFDHEDGETKENNISTLMSSSTNVNVLFKEIKKCQVLCSYCHKRKTAKQFRTWKYLRSLKEMLS